jgi:hypothetical protein
MADTKSKDNVNVVEPIPVETPGIFVYIGPNIQGVIQTNTVYSGTLTSVRESLASVIEQYPLVGSMLIPGGSLAQSRARVNMPGTLLHEYYMKLLAGK